ncbi:DUF7502 family protein [Halorussus lipolyticus]|uniref:DUF7502 family protein n=1 Tax=Halorussus lipolyticus TaxID=3034024 RepID=UPI0023E89227|nr:hypothetical protein [Halorussus sp. DT80]
MTDESVPEANANISKANKNKSETNKKESATNEHAAEENEVRAALAEIRRECRKATLVYASVDAACVLLAVDFAATVVGVPALEAEVGRAAFSSAGLPSPDLGTVVAVVAGIGAFAGEFVLRSRRPAAEQFEAANPAVSEALRTARDAAESDWGDGTGRPNPMTRALYADVLAKLRETSSVGLLNATRLAATVAVALALSLATVQTAVVGVDLGLGSSEAGAGPDAGGPTDRPLTNQTADLKSGDEILGDPTDVTAGSENLSAAVSASPGGEGDRDWNYENSDGDSGDEEVDAQRAGFSSPDRVEDAALVQRYAHRLQENATA